MAKENGIEGGGDHSVSTRWRKAPNIQRIKQPARIATPAIPTPTRDQS